MIISKADAVGLLGKAREILGEHISIDLHVSPYEVIFNTFSYSPNPYDAGIMSVEPTRYQPPVVSSLAYQEDPPRPVERSVLNGVEKMSLFLYRRAFAHIGQRVLEDQMRMGGIKRCLLLPVLHPHSDGQSEMEFVARLFLGDDRFMLGYCVPNTVRGESIGEDLQKAMRRYRIRAVKLNANISSIDLSTPAGRSRAETILRECQTNALPFFVHTGRSPVVRDPTTRDFSSLENMTKIDWGISRYPVILSHGGLMGRTQEEIENNLLPRLSVILAGHHNVYIDLSSLEIPSLRLLLANVDIARIVFGSDFPYFTQWGTIVKLLFALSQVCRSIEEPFLSILVENPLRVLAGEA